jgi:hypothetical protein
MATSRVEQARLLHQDLEQNSTKMVEDLLLEITTSKAGIARESRIAQRCELSLRTGQSLLAIYEDEDNSRKAELDKISGENVFEVFYDELKDLRRYHLTNPQIAQTQMKIGNGTQVEVKAQMSFSGEEHFGLILLFHFLFIFLCFRAFRGLECFSCALS